MNLSDLLDGRVCVELLRSEAVRQIPGTIQFGLVLRVAAAQQTENGRADQLEKVNLQRTGTQLN